MGAALRQSGKGSTGFVAVGPEWPSTYYRREMESLLAVQVDDPEDGWPTINATIQVGSRTRNRSRAMPIGCQFVRGTTKLKDGAQVSTNHYI